MQIGHSSLFSNHCLIHSLWKIWLLWQGSLMTSSWAWKSTMHMLHASTWSSAPTSNNYSNPLLINFQSRFSAFWGFDYLRMFLIISAQFLYAKTPAKPKTTPAKHPRQQHLNIWNRASNLKSRFVFLIIIVVFYISKILWVP